MRIWKMYKVEPEYKNSEWASPDRQAEPRCDKHSVESVKLKLIAMSKFKQAATPSGKNKKQKTKQNEDIWGKRRKRK